MMFRSLVAAATLLQLAAAQTYTSCQPLNQSCPPDPALGTAHLWNFSSTPSSDLWENYGGYVTYDAQKGATFTISKAGDSPTIRTKFYFFFGKTELILQASPGQGIVSSMMWLSDDLDEVDWEFLGTNTSFGFSNYFGKGRKDYDNSAGEAVANPQDDYHNYTCVWTQDKLEWWLDGNNVRTLLPAEANQTHNYPQTPMRMSVGIWAGGGPGEPAGTVEWAGGETDFSKGPFNMYVKSAYVQDYTSGKEYKYGNMSGDWQSIEIVKGNSTAQNDIAHPNQDNGTNSSFAQKWNNLSSDAKIGIYAGGASGLALIAGTLLWYIIRQRRIGARQAKVEEAKAEAERLEMEHFQKNGIDPDSFSDHAPDYSAAAAGAGAAAGAMASMRKNARSDYSEVPTSPFSDSFSTRSPVHEGLGASPVSARDPYAGARTPQLANGYGRPSPVPQSQSPFNDPPRSPQQRGYGPLPPSPGSVRSPGPGMVRSQSPAMPPLHGNISSTPLNGMRSASPASAYGSRSSPGPQQSYNSPGPLQRYGSPAPQQGYGLPRMNTPGPAGYPQRNLTGGQPGSRGPPSAGYQGMGGYR